MIPKALPLSFWLLLPAAGLCALLLWRLGIHPTNRHGAEVTPPTTLPMAGKACCEKPPNRANLLQNNTAPDSPVAAPPAAP